MKTADCPEVDLAVRVLYEAQTFISAEIHHGRMYQNPNSLRRWAALQRMCAGSESWLRAAQQEGQLDNGRWQIRHECSLCQCDDLPLVFCSGPYGTTLRCSDCANHLRYEPIPLWGDYCGGVS